MCSIRLLNRAVSYIIIALTISACSGSTETNLADNLDNIATVTSGATETNVANNSANITAVTSPANNQVSVSTSLTEVSVTFSQPIDPDSILSNNFSISPNVSYTIDKSAVTTQNTVYFRLQSELSTDTVYTLSLSNITDNSGNSISTQAWSFTTLNNTNIVDTSLPTTPSNLRNASGSPTSTSIQLIWNASTDNIGVAGYRIMRNSSLVATTTATTYTDTNLQPDTGYQYSVITFDAANNTASSNTLSVSTLQSIDTSSPTMPQNLTASIATTSANLSWSPSTDNVAVTGYRIMRNSNLIATTTDISYSDTNLQPSTAYQYTVIAIDAANNSTSSNTLSISTLSESTIGVATLNWTPPTQNTDNSALTNLSGYKIYYGLSSTNLTNTITIDNVGLTSYVIENLSNNTTYYFTVTSVNSLNIESAYSNIVSKHISG